MAGLKLAQLEERTPVKLALSLTPQLHADLVFYATLYREAYGQEESVVDLIPSMLQAFLTGDRAFGRARAQQRSGS
jgi:hypothetical protein